MTLLERTTRGHFIGQSFTEKYLTGRKHCAACRCWRHVVDFSVAKWTDEGKTVPLKLLAYCKVCVARKQRARTNGQLRQVYDGQTGTEAWHRRRLEKQRLRYRKQRKDPEWVAARRKYYNDRNRKLAYAKWVPDPELTEKQTGGGGSFDAAKFVEYLDQFTTTLDGEQVSQGVQLDIRINGALVTDNEARTIRNWRQGKVKRVNLSTADRWAIRFDLPLWEIEEAASVAA